LPGLKDDDDNDGFALIGGCGDMDGENGDIGDRGDGGDSEPFLGDAINEAAPTPISPPPPPPPPLLLLLTLWLADLASGLIDFCCIGDEEEEDIAPPLLPPGWPIG
jgi:hypothetical protein